MHIYAYAIVCLQVASFCNDVTLKCLSVVANKYLWILAEQEQCHAGILQRDLMVALYGTTHRKDPQIICQTFHSRIHVF